MTDDLAAIRARHQVRREWKTERSGNEWTAVDYCAQCKQPWPCDAAVLGAALDDAEKQHTVERAGRLTEKYKYDRLEEAFLHERQARQAAEEVPG